MKVCFLEQDRHSDLFGGGIKGLHCGCLLRTVAQFGGQFLRTVLQAADAVTELRTTIGELAGAVDEAPRAVVKLIRAIFQRVRTFGEATSTIHQTVQTIAVRHVRVRQVGMKLTGTRAQAPEVIHHVGITTRHDTTEGAFNLVRLLMHADGAQRINDRAQLPSSPFYSLQYGNEHAGELVHTLIDLTSTVCQAVSAVAELVQTVLELVCAIIEFTGAGNKAGGAVVELIRAVVKLIDAVDRAAGAVFELPHAVIKLLRTVSCSANAVTQLINAGQNLLRVGLGHLRSNFSLNLRNKARGQDGTVRAVVIVVVNEDLCLLRLRIDHGHNVFREILRNRHREQVLALQQAITGLLRGDLREVKVVTGGQAFCHVVAEFLQPGALTTVHPLVFIDHGEARLRHGPSRIPHGPHEQAREQQGDYESQDDKCSRRRGERPPHEEAFQAIHIPSLNS